MVPTVSSTTVVGTATPLFAPSPVPRLTPFSNEPGVTSVPTSLSALSPTQAQELILDLLQNNGGCKLPCWWGITPGKTSWEEAKSFLETFASKISASGPPNNFSAAAFFLGVPKEISSITMIATGFEVQDGIVEQISSHDFEGISAYHLPQFLSTYGPPSEVWLYTSSYMAEATAGLPFIVILFYPKQGILAAYSTDGEPGAKLIVGCLKQNPSLRLWSPKEALTFQKAANMFNWDVNDPPTLPLAEATDLTVEEFYQTFKSPSEIPCLETPAELWP